MVAPALTDLSIDVRTEQWPRRSPLRITGHTFSNVDVIVVTISKNGLVGEGEAAGVHYAGESPESMLRQVEAVRRQLQSKISHQRLEELLPPGGARNALDCALWDLRAKITGKPVWELAELAPPRALRTTFTCSADRPEAMAHAAIAFASAKALKLKLTGESEDAARVDAVRKAHPDVWLCVDANQGFTPSTLEALMPTLLGNEVRMIEQPFPVSMDESLDNFHSTIPIAADESARDYTCLTSLVGRYDLVNIKLDKCGGLTAALKMVRHLRQLALKPMVGSMGGTSLAMAPAFLVGQFCSVVDLDGAALLARDRDKRVTYDDGMLLCRDSIWGNRS